MSNLCRSNLSEQRSEVFIPARSISLHSVNMYTFRNMPLRRMRNSLDLSLFMLKRWHLLWGKNTGYPVVQLSPLFASTSYKSKNLRGLLSCVTADNFEKNSVSFSADFQMQILSPKRLKRLKVSKESMDTTTSAGFPWASVKLVLDFCRIFDWRSPRDSSLIEARANSAIYFKVFQVQLKHLSGAPFKFWSSRFPV